MLTAAGIDVPNLKIVGLLLTGLIWVFRERFNLWDILGTLFGISLTFVTGHDYDYICLIPLIGSLLVYTKQKPVIWFCLPPLIFSLIFPQRFIRLLEIPVLNHWRTLVVITLSVLVLLLGLHCSKIEDGENRLNFQ